jgi:hypothetical protein
MHGAGFTIVIEPPLGKTASGAEVFGPPVEVHPTWVNETRRRIRSATGETLTITATVYAHLATVCPVGSRVTLPSGRRTLALTVTRHDGGGLDVPEHVEIGCQ